MEAEKSPVSKEVIRQILENANIAKDEKRPL
jgi:fumarate hydratase subunit alpha